MKTFLWIFLVLDFLVLLLCLYETFGVSSNRSMGSMITLNVVLLASIVGGLWLRLSHPQWAFFCVALPACLVLLYVLFYIISSFGRSNWQ